MNQVNACPLGGGCKASQNIWGVINPTTNKLHRLTFSKSLADIIIKSIGDEYRVQRFQFKTWKRLSQGEKSHNGIYAIMSAKKHFALRIALTQESAEIYNDNDSRYLAEIELEEKYRQKVDKSK